MELEINCCKYYKEKIDLAVDEEALSSLDQAISKIIKNEGFKTYTVEKKPISTEGGNYLADLCEIDIKGKTAEGKEKELNLFTKNILTNKATEGFLVLTEAYVSELLAYKDVLQLYEKLQEQANIPVKDRFVSAKLYDGSNHEVIILENLTKKGFVTTDRFDSIPLDFVELSIQQLAKFHALSFALDNKYPGYIERKVFTKKAPVMMNEQWEQFNIKCVEYSLKQVDDENLKKKVQVKAKNLIEQWKKYYTFGPDIDGNICVCHVDYRQNNILAKTLDGKITEIIPVDYQFLHYGCPVNDFIYFIYGCTDRSFRNQHLARLKEVYYETFVNFLKYFNIKADEVYPKKIFEQTYEDRLSVGLYVGLVLLNMFLAGEDAVESFQNEQSDLSYGVHSSFKERLTEILEEFDELGYL